MELAFYSSRRWESWEVQHKPAIPEGIPILVDDDLRFEDGAGLSRPTVVVNEWLRGLPTNGGKSANTWGANARALRDWLVFLAEHGVQQFDTRDQLRSVLSAYTVHRADGPPSARFRSKTWNLHISVL